MPEISHVMEPVIPGRYAVVTVGGADDATRVYAKRLADSATRWPGDGDAVPTGASEAWSVAQRKGDCLTADVPAGEHGVMAVMLAADGPLDDAFIVNRPRIDWAYPSPAQPGAPLRLIGRGFVHVDHYPTVDPTQPVCYGGMVEGVTRIVARRAGDSAFVELRVHRSSAYDVHLTVPADFDDGAYELFAHNGRGGAAGWSQALPLTVESRAPWPTTHYDADAYISKAGGVDDGLAAALAEIDAVGGGVLQLSARGYHIQRTIVLPARTVLRGVGRGRTLIRLTAGNGPQPPYVAITGDGDFAVEDLRIEATHAPVLICAPRFEPTTFDEALHVEDHVKARAANVAVRRCRLQQYILGGAMRRRDREQLDKVYALLRRGPQHIEGYQGIVIRGDHIEVEDNIIYGGGSCVALNRATQARVAGNVLKAGASGQAMQCYSHLDWPDNPTLGNTGAKIEGSYTRDIIVEHNDCSANCTTTRNLVNFMRGGENIHLAGNHIHDISTTTDGEAMLTHLWFARWTEPTIEMTGPTTGRIIDPTGEVTNESLDGAAIDIVGGRGVGQLRRIVRREGEAFEIDKPWLAVPDASSQVVFTAPPPFGPMNIVDNRIENAPINIILWGNSRDIVVDGNYTADGPGITVWSIRFKGDQKVWGGAAFTLVCNNTMDRGFSVPDTQEHALDAAVGFFVRCSKAYDCTAEGYDILGLVVRDNFVTHNTGIGLRVTYTEKQADDTHTPWRIDDAGMVIEHNHITDSAVGVAVEQGAHAVVRDNTCDNVAWPLTWAPAGV